jgi:hypothetical protein
MISEFGADCLISKRPWLPSTPMMSEINRRRVNRLIGRGQGAEYEYPEDGRTPLVTIVWDMPRRRSHDARAIVRRALSTHHIHDDDVAHVWALTKAQPHPPLRSEMSVSRALTLDGIVAANCQHVLLMGGPVTSLWWPEVKINRVAGNGYIWDVVGRTFTVFPMFSPLALKHDLDVETYMRTFSRVAWAVREESILQSLDLVCHQSGCWQQGIVWDQRAVAWCDRHFNISKATNQENKWIVDSNRQNQQTLL